ncbi:MAG: zinc-ribbon domain-containing protein [Pseudomonadota bacterium]
MRIVCPNCSAQYEVDARLFSDEGRAVQCAQCGTRWTQHRVEDDAPVPLRADAAPKPSENLPDAEREAIRAAVAEEIAIRDGEPATVAPAAAGVAAARRGFAAVEEQAPAPQEETEEDLIKSLREQLSEAERDDDDDIDDERRPTGRRDLSRAIDMAGIDVDDSEDEVVDDRRSARAGSINQSELAAALQEYERERGPRGGTRWGFVTVVFLFLIAFGVYFARAEIGRSFPAAQPILAQYETAVDGARVWVVETYGTVREMVAEQMSDLQEPAAETSQ